MSKNKYIPPEPMHIGDFIKWQLELLDLTLDDLSKKTGIDISVLRNIIKRKRDINLDIAMKLEKVFGLPADGFLKIQTNYYQHKHLLKLKKQANTPAKKKIFQKLLNLL